MHARHEEIRRHYWGPSRRPLHMCRQTSTEFGQIKAFLGCLAVMCVITCLAQTPALPEIFFTNTKCFQKHRHHLHTHAENKDLTYFLQLLLSDEYSYIEQNFCFFLGIASLQKKDCPFDRQPMKLQELGRCARHAQIYFFSGPWRPV